MKINIKKILILLISSYIPLIIPAPRVSIITSIYDGDTYIEGFLSDIIQQTIFDQCELILINANSPDNEETIIKKYVQRYPNIIYKKLDHDPGLYAVWNIAIKMSHATLITNANIDDRRNPEIMGIFAHTLEENPSIDLVYSAHIKTTISNRPFNDRMKVLPYNKWHENNIIIDPQSFTHQNMRACLPGPFPMWRKSIHEKWGYFNEQFKVAGDYEMWLRAVHNGAQFKKIAAFSGVFYWNQQGLSLNNKHNQDIRQWEGAICDQYSYLWKS